MREIKFRAWDSYQKKMYSWAELGEMDAAGHLSLWNTLIGEVEHIAPLEFAGLKDKNGVEIYEDDLALIDEELMRVVWSERDACFGWIYCNPCTFAGDYMDDGVIWERVVLLGNAHENPELLENADG